MTCMANPTADPPRDCDYPFCGCYEEATRCVEALQESGWGPIATEMAKVQDLAMLLRRVMHYGATTSIRADCWNYLKRNNLLGSPLRDSPDTSAAEPK